MSRPLAVHRHEEIVRRLKAAGTVSVGELADAFAVSHETIRRDLKLLADQGHLEVVHGGAALREDNGSAFAPRRNENPQGQAAIARAAVRLVPEGATVLLDSGATASAIALELASRRGLTVCTNSLSNAAVLCRVPSHRVYMLGGEVDRHEEGTSGVDVISAVKNLRVDVAFVGAGGFAEDGTPTDHSRSAAEMRGGMILSGNAFLVADHPKFDMRTPFRIPHGERAAGVIVDRLPEARVTEAWKGRDWNIIIGE
jgi:DeoR family transcriptional regulator, glycerol-3-phosphate regulon repressor